MSIIDKIGRIGAELKKARNSRKAIREMNALPSELQKDIGWPATPGARSGGSFHSAYWKSLR